MVMRLVIGMCSWVWTADTDVPPANRTLHLWGNSIRELSEDIFKSNSDLR